MFTVFSRSKFKQKPSICKKPSCPILLWLAWESVHTVCSVLPTHGHKKGSPCLPCPAFVDFAFILVHITRENSSSFLSFSQYLCKDFYGPELHLLLITIIHCLPILFISASIPLPCPCSLFVLFGYQEPQKASLSQPPPSILFHHA